MPTKRSAPTGEERQADKKRSDLGLRFVELAKSDMNAGDPLGAIFSAAMAIGIQWQQRQQQADMVDASRWKLAVNMGAHHIYGPGNRDAIYMNVQTACQFHSSIQVNGDDYRRFRSQVVQCALQYLESNLELRNMLSAVSFPHVSSYSWPSSYFIKFYLKPHFAGSKIDGAIARLQSHIRMTLLGLKEDQDLTQRMNVLSLASESDPVKKAAAIPLPTPELLKEHIQPKSC